MMTDKQIAQRVWLWVLAVGVIFWGSVVAALWYGYTIMEGVEVRWVSEPQKGSVH